MTHYCKYHPLDEAEWHCALCRVEFCSPCSPDIPDQESPVHYCPLCNGELKHLGASDSAAPFWQQLTYFLRYPLSPIGVALLLLAFVVPVFLGNGMTVYAAAAVVLLLVVKYAWTALERISGGELEPVGMEKLAAADNNDLAVAVGIILLALCGVTAYVYAKMPVYATVLVVFFLIMLPAFLVAIATDRNVSTGLGVEGLRSALMGVGPVYLVVALLSVLIFATLQSLVSIFADILPSAWGRAMTLTAYSYFVIVLFVLCGYLLLQYQESLGFTAVSGGSKTKRVARKIDPAVIAVQMFLKEGNYARASGILRKETEKKSAAMSTHERYHKLLLLMNDEQGLRNHAQNYFKMMLDSGRDTQAVALMREYNQRLTGFRPEDPELCHDLAVAFERLGDYKLAVHMLNGMHKDAPHYSRLPDAYLLAARILAEKLNLPQKALALVQFLDGRFKAHKSYPNIQAALRTLAAQTKPG